MFNNVSPLDIGSIYSKLPEEIRIKPTASEIKASFINSLKLLDQSLEQENTTESEKNVNPSRLLIAGTCIAYAKHLANQNELQEAIKQVEKAEKIYKMIDFEKTTMNQSAEPFIKYCKVLKDAYSTQQSI